MNKRKVFLRTFLVLLFCCFVAGELFVYADLLNKKLNSQIETILNEISAQSVLLVQKEVDNQLNILSELANRISDANPLSREEKIKILVPAKEQYGFRNLGILYDDYTLYMADEGTFNLKESLEYAKEVAKNKEYAELVEGEFLSKVFNGEVAITDPVIDLNTKEEIILYGMPVYEEVGVSRNVSAVVLAVYSSSALREIIDVTSFNGQGYSYIIKSDGDMVIRSSNLNSFWDSKNIYDSMLEADERNIESVENMKQIIESGQSGYITFYNKVPKYMDCTPAGINDWYVLNVIPESVMNKISNSIMLNTYVLIFAVLVLFAVLGIYILWIERRENKRLINILYTDKLTGGYSFQRFSVEAYKLIEQKNLNYAVIVMDIDKFKLINELLGYKVGDKALIHISERLKSGIKEDEIFARRESDKFAILIHFKDTDDIIARIEEISKDFHDEKAEGNYVLKPVFGIYVVDKSLKLSVKKMFNYALIALSSVKGNADVSYAFFNDELSEKLKNDKLMEDMIAAAYENEEFVVYYQPKYDAASKKMVGAEALIRWKKPDGTIVPPYKFVPIAENNGFIVNLDKYVFEKVCRQQKKWLDEGLSIVPVSVNLSRTHLYNSSFIYEYKSIVDEIGLPIKYVQLEITESALFDNQAQFLNIVDKLHSFGFMILMDDFGTGYSSLMMLKSIPIDVLKLDKSFVDDYNDAKGEKIITYITQLAKSINISVTAEGVETEEQYSFLKDLGCDLIQGYYFAKPMPQEDFEREIRKIND